MPSDEKTTLRSTKNYAGDNGGLFSSPRGCETTEIDPAFVQQTSEFHDGGIISVADEQFSDTPEEPLPPPEVTREATTGALTGQGPSLAASVLWCTPCDQAQPVVLVGREYRCEQCGTVVGARTETAPDQTQDTTPP
jgi:hypothetical protein